MSIENNVVKNSEQEFPFDPVALIRQVVPLAVVALIVLFVIAK